MKIQYIIIFGTIVSNPKKMSHIDHSNAKPLYKAFHGLYLNLQRSFTECNAVKLNPTVKPVDSWMQLPLPAKMRNQLRSSNGNNTPSMEYFPDEIQHHILNEQSVAVTYKFNMGTRKVVLHFVEFNTHTPDLKKMQAHARSVCALMHLVSMHASRSACSSALNIYMYMTDFKKRFPIKKGEVIDTEHANTGMSYHCSTTNDIVVYRKEEWFKVLIHESFHAFGLSFIENDMPKGVDRAMQTMLQKMYSISHSVRIYETYCEIWARILNVMFDCFVDDHATPVYGTSTSNNPEFQVFMECVMEGLDANARFAQQQCAKLLRYADISHETLTQSTESNRAIVLKKYRENTNVFAYYVLTHVLLNSSNEFIVWCYRNNPLTPDKKGIMQFRAIPANFNGFMELLYHCKQRCPALDYSELNDADVVGSSMRMTVSENE